MNEPKRTKEQIALAKAEAAEKRAARQAVMLAKCAAKTGAPCARGCDRSCQRNAAGRKAGKARRAAAAAKAQSMAGSVGKRLAARVEANEKRLAAVTFNDKAKAKPGRELKRFRIEVLYLCGYSIDEIATALGDDEKRGSVNGIITRAKLADVRNGGGMVQRLIELDEKAPYGQKGYVDHIAAKGRVRGLYDEIRRLRSIKPESVVTKEIRRGVGEIYRNPNSSALQRAARSGQIEEYNVYAGMLLHDLFWMVQDITAADGELVSGGGGDADHKMVRMIDSARDIHEAKRAVKAAFEIDGTASWRWAVVDHVVLHDQVLSDFQFPAGMAGSHARFLNDALTPVALLFNAAPTGVAVKAPTRDDWARYEFAQAMKRARMLRLERDQPLYDPTEP